MEFGLKTKFTNNGTYCKVEKAFVSLNLKLTLPNWKNRPRASKDMALMWDTLSSDIKRHEERHAIIARNHALELERTLENLPRKKDCKIVQAAAEQTADRILSAHSKAQADFDKVESINFEARLTRLLGFRVQKQAN
jgi:predicted secreted Zn-dependent protease